MTDWVREFLFFKIVPIVLVVDVLLLLLVLVVQIWCLVKYGHLFTG